MDVESDDRDPGRALCSGQWDSDLSDEDDGQSWRCDVTGLRDVTDTAPAQGSSAHRQCPLSDGSVIVHFDLDCFYAQVEMLRNPELRNVPLGVQQKYLVVTCNYVARRMGVNKLMTVTAARERCPRLVLVSGEDLTHYREMSDQVTELLRRFSGAVERLGFDENFIDVSDTVRTWTTEKFTSEGMLSFEGHVYDHKAPDPLDPVHIRLALGSKIAAMMREQLHRQLGLTSCAGIAENKLLAKLVCSAHKPNQQTLLLPESVDKLLTSLERPSQLPGIGQSTSMKLKRLGVNSMDTLRACPLEKLESELGSEQANTIKNLSRGVDPSPINPSGLPQSLSDEDSFKNCSSEEAAKQKMEELLKKVLPRLHKDGRLPGTVRVTIRRAFSGKSQRDAAGLNDTMHCLRRESRQCPVPTAAQRQVQQGDFLQATRPLLVILMKLFHKLVDVTKPFHLTLINVCFCKLTRPSNKDITERSIDDLLASSSHLSQSKMLKRFISGNDDFEGRRTFEELKSLSTKDSVSNVEGQPTRKRQRTMHDALKRAECQATSSSQATVQNVDREVFLQLPVDIQEEILANCPREQACLLSTLVSSTEPHSVHQVEVEKQKFSDRLTGCTALPECLTTEAPCMEQEVRQEPVSPIKIVLEEDRFLTKHNSPCTSTSEIVTTTISPLHGDFTEWQDEEPDNRLTDLDATKNTHISRSGTRFSSDERNADFDLRTSTTPNTLLDQKSDFTCSSDHGSLPNDVDPQVFRFLPAAIQNELLASWRATPHVCETPSLKAAKQSQGIERYFKKK
uniref:Polymerase (DNA directed) iota n=1 Tax=Eptatretus burgeri TaxID=7764 RepID=A0A8C4NP29_EPTBU